MYSAKTKTMDTKELRFLSVKDHYGITSDTRFGKMIGVQRDTIAKIRSGKIQFTGKTREGFEKAFPKINMNWIDLGEGSMLIESEEPLMQIAQEPELPYQKKHNDKMITISATKAFTSYYEQINLIRKLLDSKQEEFIEVYEHLAK